MNFSQQYDLASVVNQYLNQNSGFSRSQLAQRVCDDIANQARCSPYDANLYFEVTDEINRQNDLFATRKNILNSLTTISPERLLYTPAIESDDAVLNWQGQLIRQLEQIYSAQSLFEQGMILYSIGNHATAYKSFSLAYQKGNIRAGFCMGQMLMFGAGTQQNTELAFQRLKECSDQNACYAHFDVGFCYYAGWGTAIDIYKAEEYFLKAAACQDYRAHVCLAGIYVEERSAGLQDYRKALEFAQAGVNHLQNISELASWYQYGLYLSGLILMEGHQDAAQGLAYHLKAAQLGNSASQNALAYAKFHGTGCAVDKGEAVYWWGQAVQKDELPEACYHLAVMYLNGDHVAQDYVYARQLLQKAIVGERVPHAEYYLGVMYWHGYGGEQNQIQAVQLFQSACRKGVQQACDALRPK